MFKKVVTGSLILVFWIVAQGHASFLDVLKDALDQTAAKTSQTGKIDLGLKEALQIGITNAIKYLGKKDGYFGDAAVKILLPEDVRKVEKAMRTIGLGSELDEFTLSMNRAAEKAAPLAADIFSEAIAGMSFDDASRILRGGNTAATDYLRNKTYDRLFALFEPAVRQSMNEYGVTRQYDAIAGQVKNLPVVGKSLSLDVNRYVAAKALDGLFLVLSREETEIRTNPKARVTDLLKEVFR